MPGNSRKGIVIQERDRQLLRELAVMRVVDREQAKRIACFGSTTRVNVRLLSLTRAGLLRRFYSLDGQKAYYTLTIKGAQLAGAAHRGLQRRSDEAAITGSFVQHQSAINDLYCPNCGNLWRAANGTMEDATLAYAGIYGGILAAPTATSL